MDDISRRLGSLLREAGIRQKDVAGWWSGHLGYEVHRSRVSRGLRGKVDLPGSEKVALFEAMIEHGVLRDRADGLFVAEQLRLAREVLDEALPPNSSRHQPVTAGRAGLRATAGSTGASSSSGTEKVPVSARSDSLYLRHSCASAGYTDGLPG